MLDFTTDLGQSHVLAGVPLKLDSAVFPVPTESVLHLLVGVPVRHVGVPVQRVGVPVPSVEPAQHK